MSAPIDDLLYGGDDSGDEDDLNAMPMSSFSAPLPSTGALPLVAPPPGVLGPPAGVVGVVPPPMSAASVSAPVASLASTSASTAPRPTSAGAAGAGPVKQPGSGHQMFQQMFALLKQMLPPEQYAALHSEMRNGNGNDIKSIVDIIKRIAGDAIFASVIQRMDLTRNQSAAAGSLGIVKNEPALAAGQAAAAVAGIPMGTPPASASTTPAGARAAPVARPLATPPPSAPLAQPPTMTPSPPIASAAAPPTAVQRPTLVAATPPVTAVKAEPSSSFTPSPSVPVATATPAPAPTAATPAAPVPLTAGDASSATGGKNDTQEKIQFAKKLLFHASSCTLPPGTCQVKRCDDVRRVFKHSVSCSTRSCSHCRQLRALVEYHAKECHVPVGEHCKIPFCDAIRRNNAAARARAVSVGNNATTAAPATSAVAATATTTASAVTAAVSATTAATAPSASTMSSDDEDNTPLASAMTKVKKNAKAKSPKSGPVSAGSSSSVAAAKKKSAAKPASSTPTSTASTPSSTGSSTPAAAAAAAAKPKPSGTLTQAQEYGRLLQIILHVEKCKSSACAVGEECVEAKTLLRQVNSPDAPARAQTFKKVFAHYKVCLAKNNTQNCPMCKIGLQPIDTSSGSSAAATSSGAAATATISVSSSAAPSAAPSAPTSSPTVAALKRTNSSVASPRSPSKKPRVTTKGSGKMSNDMTMSTAATSAAASAAAAADHHSSDLSSTNRNDLRKEEDVLTHTGIDLNTERRAMMMDRFGSKPKKIPEQLHSTKHAWLQNDLFQNDKLTRHMERIARQQGVSLGGSSAATTKIMAHALQEYLKQVMEEMVEAATLRGDVTGQAVDALVKKDLGSSTAPRELTSTDILRVSCDDSFARLRHDDMALRANLLEEAKREELAEKERSKKRKKVDRVKLLAQEEKDEAEMDIEELAIKDLKERLLQEDKDGVVRVDGRVNESLTSKFQRRVDHQVTIEDASYWLENQKPYVNTKLFVRAEAARIATNALL